MRDCMLGPKNWLHLVMWPRVVLCCCAVAFKVAARDFPREHLCRVVTCCYFSDVAMLALDASLLLDRVDLIARMAQDDYFWVRLCASHFTPSAHNNIPQSHAFHSKGETRTGNAEQHHSLCTEDPSCQELRQSSAESPHAMHRALTQLVELTASRVSDGVPQFDQCLQSMRLRNVTYKHSTGPQDIKNEQDISSISPPIREVMPSLTRPCRGGPHDGRQKTQELAG